MKTKMSLRAVILSEAVLIAAHVGAEEVVGCDYFTVFEDHKTLSVSSGETLDPAAIDAPAFWLDASDTTGWTIENGAVTKIPSKCSPRCLEYANPSDWTGWGDTPGVPPVFTACDAKLGLPCVDFGASGSGRILSFDGGLITNICTVIAVGDADTWGGWLFSGPHSADGLYTWHRGYIVENAAYKTVYDYRNPVAAPSASSEASSRHFYSALLRQNGLPYAPYLTGWTGDWEVFSLGPTNSTALSAVGIGFGDFFNIETSGGMKYAELLVYDRLLDVETVAKIERFLARKWGLRRQVFGTVSRVHVDVMYATVHTNNGMQVEINVDAGSKLSVGEFRGGRNYGLINEPRFIKTGEGVLEVGNSQRYDGTVELRGGEIRLSVAAASPESFTNGFAFPKGVACHFDFSRRETMTLSEESGVEYLTRVYDVDGRAYNGGVINLKSRGVQELGGDQRPWLSDEYVTPTGLKMLDFGPWIYDRGESQPQYSRGLEFAHGDTAGNPFTFTTVIAAIGAQRGGGWLHESGFKRALQGESISTGLLSSETKISSSPELYPGDGVAYVDGYKVRNPYTTGYPSTGFHVVALQIPGSQVAHFGEYWKRAGGALIIGEYLAWNRPLTEDEIIAVQDYLSVKWLGRTCKKAVGRADDVPMLAKLAATGDGTVTVGAGSAKVRKLTLDSRLVKKGPGTLFVNEIVKGGNGVLVVSEGAVKAGAEPALTSEGIAAAPSLRIDTTDTNGWVFVKDNGTNFVKSLPAKGEAGVTVYQDSAVFRPYIRDEEDFVAKSAVPAVDFGAFSHHISSSVSKYLGFSKSLESVRSVFMVWRRRDSSESVIGSSFSSEAVGNNAVLLGASYLSLNEYHNPANDLHLGAYLYDYHPGARGQLFGSGAAAAVRGGEAYTNGVKIAASEMTAFKPVEEEWQLVEAHTLAGTHASALAVDRKSMRGGGFALAEVIVYERELTGREKTATRNYLMKKWFGKSDEELAPVPPAGDASVELPELKVDGEMEIDTIGVKRLTGAGKIVKTGEGESSVFDAASFTGSVTVAGGTLNFTGICRAEPKMATDGLRMRLAADHGLELIDNADGTRGVIEWANSVEDDWKAVAPTGYVINAEEYEILSRHAPNYLESELNGLPVVDMPRLRCFRFIDPQGNYASVTGIRNVFWVVGSQRGGGWLLGGGDLGSSNFNAKEIAWHRGSNPNNNNSSGENKLDRLIGGSAYEPNKRAAYSTWRKNGEEVAPMETSLSGEWDLLAYSALPVLETHASYTYPGASGLAFDGRIFDGNPDNGAYDDRAGNQTLAEVLIYTNELTEAEILETESYLNCKWGLNSAVASSDYAIDLALAEGTVVNLAGLASFKSVGGAGTVNGNFSSAGLAADFSSAGFLTVNGVYTLPASPKVQLANVPENLPAETKLLEADGIEGLENCLGVVAAGDTDGGKLKVRLRERDGALYARVNTYNMVIICR